MINIKPSNQVNLYGLSKFLNELVSLEKNGNLPNKILLSGQKGLGKSTLAYHFINYSLSKNEEHSYDIDNYKIIIENTTFKTIQNGSNPNLNVIDIQPEKKSIDINQIRELIIHLNKSSFNEKPRFVLIDNIEFLNTNSINALLKILEEPTLNVHFILIHNQKRILPTLLSRCINFRISLSNKESLAIANILLENKLYEFINKDLINYYQSPGNIFNLAKFAIINDYDFSNMNLKEFLKFIITNTSYKNNETIKYLIFDFFETYFRNINSNFSSNIYDKYTYFLKRVSETKKFNLDEESLFNEFEKKVLSG